MKQNLLLIICVFSFCVISKAQSITFSGFIKNEISNRPIEGASVVVKLDAKFLGYDYTDENGYYKLSVEATEISNVVLEANSLGYNGFKERIILSNQTRVERTILLSEKIENLSTVVIKSREKIEINRDTIAYRLSAFKDGTEKNVEDMLKNLPGIKIDANGNIEALGKPIQKILIEGDDLADRNYKVISKNLDASVLHSVEIINNYDENPVLKQFLSSDNVVINLKLKEDKKSLLFGKAEAGAGIENRFLGDVNLGLINPNFKFLNLGFLNNVGRFAGNQLDNYQFRAIGFNDFSKSFEMKHNPVVYLNGAQIELEDENYVENESFSNSLLFNKKFSQALKIKNTLFVYKDSFEKNYENTNTYLIDPPIMFTEQSTYENDDFSFGNNLELQWTPTENSNVLFKNNMSIKNAENSNVLVVDNETVSQQLENKHEDIDVHGQYTKKIKNGALVVDGFVGLKNANQSFQIRPNRFGDEDTNSNSDLLAHYDSSFNYFGLESALVFKSGKTSHSYTFGMTNLNESIDGNVFDSLNNTAIVDSLSGKDSAQNLKPHLQVKLQQPIAENLIFNADVDAEVNIYKKNNPSDVYFLPNFEVNLKLNKTKTGSYRIGFERNSEVERLDKFLDYFVLKSYRSVGLGAEKIKPLNRNRYYFGHSYSNIKKRIFFDASLSYIHHENDFTSQTLLDDNSNISRRIYTEGQKMLFFNTSLTTYIDAIDMSMKFAYQRQYSEQQSLVNSVDIISKNNTSSFVVTGTTFFKGFFNFNFLLSYVKNKGKNLDNLVKNNRFRVEVDAIFKLNKELIFKMTSKNFTVNSQFYATNQIEMEYAPKAKDWSLGFRAQNIFNDSNYSFQNISDYLQSEILFEAVPRYGYVYSRIRF